MTQVMIQMLVGEDGPLVGRHAPKEGVWIPGATGGAGRGEAIDQDCRAMRSALSRFINNQFLAVGELKGAIPST